MTSDDQAGPSTSAEVPTLDGVNADPRASVVELLDALERACGHEWNSPALLNRAAEAHVAAALRELVTLRVEVTRLRLVSEARDVEVGHLHALLAKAHKFFDRNDVYEELRDEIGVALGKPT